MFLHLIRVYGTILANFTAFDVICIRAWDINLSFALNMFRIFRPAHID